MDRCIGHQRARTFFARAQENGSLHHAFLLTGPDGVGKTHLARLWAAELLQTTPDQLGSHPDFLTLARPVDEKTGKQKTQITAKQVRDLRERLSMSSFMGGWHVAFIEEAAFMNTAATNALLKILEAPPARVCFFLRAPRVADLLDTIVSRAQLIRLGNVAQPDIVEGLVDLGASPKEAETIARLSRGLPGRAVQLFSQPSALAEIRERAELYAAALGRPYWRNAVLAGSLVPKGAEGRAEAASILADWEGFTRDQLLHSLGCADLASGVFDEGGSANAGHWVQCAKKQMRAMELHRTHVPAQRLFETILLELSYA